MAKNTMLDYSKLILQKVSFDIQLFHKELGKALTHLCEHEIKELENWLRKNFAPQMAVVPQPLKLGTSK